MSKDFIGRACFWQYCWDSLLPFCVTLQYLCSHQILIEEQICICGLCAGFESVCWYSAFCLKQLRTKILKWHVLMLTARDYCRHDINWIVMLNLVDTDCSHIPQFKVWNKIYIFIQNRNNCCRWGIKFKPWLSHPQEAPHFSLLSVKLKNEQIVFVRFCWTTLPSANKEIKK
jgi:hypothetical protein